MVTIIIPSYNYARFLPDAIESALAQSGAGIPLEVLVIDDGSTDHTPEVVAGYDGRIRCVRKENAGLSAARNTGMQEAKHDWVLFLDSDDMLERDALALLWRAREEAVAGCAVIAGRDCMVDADGHLLALVPQVSGRLESISPQMLVLRNRFAPAVLADRRCLLKLGGFDSGLHASEDRDMWIRVAVHHPVMLLHRITLKKRDHGGNMSRAASRQTDAIQRVLGKAFANPALRLSWKDRRLARAVCAYQSALMYSDAGEHGVAALQMLRSIARWPLGATQAAIPNFSRMRGLLSNLRKSLR